MGAILLVGLLLRVATVIVLDIQPESDYAAYHSMALNLLHGKGIVDSMGNRAMYSVGYPLFVLAPVFALFGNNLLAAQLVNAVLGVVSMVACYAIARGAGAGPVGRLLSPALWALYLPSWVYAEYLAKENLMTPLMLGVLWCALRLSNRVSIGMAAACGMLFGLLALTGDAGLVLALAAAYALLLADAPPRRKLIACSTALIATLAIVAPWMIRNVNVLGAAVLNTNGGFNLYIGNNPAATGYFISIADTPRGPSWANLRRAGEAQASETLRREALGWIQEHPLQCIGLALRKAMLFWMPPVHQGKGPPEPMEALMRRLWLLEFVILTAGAVGGAFVPALRTRYLGVLWLAIIGYTAVHMLFYVIYRYREPIMPVVCILAALTVEDLWIRWTHKPRLGVVTL